MMKTKLSTYACKQILRRPINRASDISRKKKKNFAGFSGANSRENWPISRDFRGKKVKFRGKIGRFRGIFAGESQNSQKNRPISRVLTEKVKF